MGKEMEGDEQQRRARAAEARARGNAPSEEGVTTGASKQESSLQGRHDHEERISHPGRGKQQPDRASADPRPGSMPTPGAAQPLPETMPPKAGTDRPAQGDLGEDDEAVFETLARLESERGEPPTAGAIAREAGLSTEQAVPALQRLMDDHDIVRELPPEPDVGRRYTVKTRT